MPKAADPLGEYARKRRFDETPEPRGTKRSAAKTLRFVVQMHRATRLHYDFRLEAGGVLASWAIPKGPTFDTREKRLAMKVEDHPFDYRSFEGIIPDGNYGAGEVIVWDEGTYRLAEGSDPVAEIAAGKIKFIMRGKKLHGEFTLVRIKNRDGSGDPWLLIKDHDEYVDPDYDVDQHPQSVKSGQTLADIKKSKTAKQWISDRPAAAASTKKTTRAKAKAASDPLPHDLSPMLATLVDRPFNDAKYLFEVKWDGYRAIAEIATSGDVTLTSRNGNDLLGQFPELRELASAFRSLPVVVDGEICILDADGKPSFQALQSRDKRFAKGAVPSTTGVTYVAFDLMYADGRDVRGESLDERKRLLEELIVDGHGVMFSKHVVGDGEKLFAFAQSQGLEGIVGKLRASTYRSTRSRDWVKIKALRRQEFVIGGWTEPRGSRAEFGALLLGVYDGKKLIYAGHVGTGFDTKLLHTISAQLRKIERATSPFEALPKTATKAHFVSPTLVAEISFAEWTRDGILRHPVFVGMRADKDAAAVIRETELPAAQVH